MKQVKGIWIWLATSFLVAAASCFAPRVYPHDPVLWVSLGLSGLWVLVFVLGMLFEKRRGLWLLTTAPLAFFVPVVLFLWERACRLNINACP